MVLQNEIMGISGPQGCGKTTALTALGYIAFNQGTKIYSNYYVNYTEDDTRDYHPIGCLDDIKYMKGGAHGAVWLADELYQWLFSRSSQSDINKKIGMVLMVARKRGISIYYTSHHPMHVDVMLRRVTNKWLIPQMLPIHQISQDKIKQLAQKKDIDPHTLLKWSRKQIKKDPSLWMIKCDEYNDIGRHIKTFTIKNIGYWGQMFNTTEEVNPLDLHGKPEYIREKGMELELEWKNNIPKDYTYIQIHHSGRENPDTHADGFLFPNNNEKKVYYVDITSTYDNGKQIRLNKEGKQIKALLEESQNTPTYTTLQPDLIDRIKKTTDRQVIIPFPYHNDWWILPVKKDHYYINYTSKLTVSYDLKQLMITRDDFFKRGI